MKRNKPLRVSQKHLKQKFYKEANMVMKRSQTTGQFMRNFNFLVENKFLGIEKPKDTKLFFWNQSLKEFKPIPTSNSYVKNKFKRSKMNSKEGSVGARNDLNKIFQKLLKKNEQQREIRLEKIKFSGLPNQETFRKCLEENDRGKVYKKVKVKVKRKICSKFQN
jgi:hypothetical protein